MNVSSNKVISENRKLLQNPYAYLNGEGEYEAILTSNLSQINSKFSRLTPDIIRGHALRKRKEKHEYCYSFSEIENIARKLQIALWKLKANGDSSNSTINPVEVLDAAHAIRNIGYDYQLAESLGQFSLHGKLMEVAGIIDNHTRNVKISRKFQTNVRNFTAAHELGHAILHDARGLHRDRPLDGTSIGESREAIELEADKFACYFLMPRKLIRSRFKQLFCTEKFLINDDTLFALAGRNP